MDSKKATVLESPSGASDFFDNYRFRHEDGNAPPVLIEYIEDDYLPNFQIFLAYGYTGVNPNIVQYYLALLYLPDSNIAFPLGYYKRTGLTNGTYDDTRAAKAMGNMHTSKFCLGIVYISETVTPADMPAVVTYLNDQSPPILYNWYVQSRVNTSDIMDDVIDFLDAMSPSAAHGTSGTTYINSLTFKELVRECRKRSNKPTCAQKVTIHVPVESVESTPEWFPGEFPDTPFFHMVFFDGRSFYIPNGSVINEIYSRAVKKYGILYVQPQSQLDQMAFTLYGFPARSIVAYGKWAEYEEPRWGSAEKTVYELGQVQKAGHIDIYWNKQTKTVVKGYSVLKRIKTRDEALKLAKKLESQGNWNPVTKTVSRWFL